MTKKDQIRDMIDDGVYEDSEIENPTAHIADEVDCSRDYVRQVKRDYKSEDSSEEEQDSGNSDPETSEEETSEESGIESSTFEEDNSEDSSEQDDVDESDPYSDYDSVEEFKEDSHNCGKCGAEVNYGVTYCPSCGTNLKPGMEKALKEVKARLED